MTTLPKPIGRLAFLGRWLLAILGYFVLYVFLTWTLWLGIKGDNENIFFLVLPMILWLLAFLFLVMCFVRFAVIARLVSIGYNRWCALFLLVPLVNILFMLFLLFCPARKPPEPPAPTG